MSEPQESVLEEAQRLIHGQRNKDYGHPRENIGHTAAMWSAYLGVEVTPLDVCHMMQQLKQSRMKTTGYHRDSNVDIGGYAGVAERIYEEVEHEGQLSLSDVGQMIRDSWGRQDLDITIEVSEPEHVAGFEEQQAQIPRVWESLADVPHDVRVKDKEGDVWVYHISRIHGEGWGFLGKPAVGPLSEYDYVAPFVEILG